MLGYSTLLDLSGFSDLVPIAPFAVYPTHNIGLGNIGEWIVGLQ